MTKDTICSISLGLVLLVILILLISACGSSGSIAVVKHYGCTVEGTQLICADGTSFDLEALQGADGTNGVDGQNGIDGQDGENGQDGQDGINGFNSLIEVTKVCCDPKPTKKVLFCITPKPCKKEGLLIETGLDMNRDNFLQDSEVMNSTVICD